MSLKNIQFLITFLFDRTSEAILAGPSEQILHETIHKFPLVYVTTATIERLDKLDRYNFEWQALCWENEEFSMRILIKGYTIFREEKYRQQKRAIN